MQQSQFIANYLTVKIDSTAHKGTGSPQGDGPPGTVGSIEGLDVRLLYMCTLQWQLH